ncbi:hypothetical protein Sango_0850400 [Sesamum angolense]|uniref:DUF4005 domain-containing protein n=1 Tax=Sesamum angolense TaxID=2727404 RepID=A0AAE1X4R2_9LAMI|nr:hypothetical protein Sango_0850400 [Sesamum angolense]
MGKKRSSWFSYVKRLFIPQSKAKSAEERRYDQSLQEITIQREQKDQQEMVVESNSPFSLPRRSFCQVKQKSIREDGSLPSSPVSSTYMAATESAKAKSRSLSTPRQRLRLSETYSGELSPVGISSWSSFNSEINKSNKRNSISQYTSSTLGTPN